MNPSIFRFSLDFHRTQSQVSIPVFYGDTGVEFHITLSDGVRAYIITDGCLAKLSIKRPTGTRIEEFCAIRDNATIVYSFMQNENTAAVEGTHECDITLYDTDGGRVGTARFTMVVSERVVRSDDIVLTDDDFTAVNAMMNKEAERQVAEEERKSAEQERIDTYNSILADEKARNDAEAERVANEEARINAGATAMQAVADAVDAATRAEASATRTEELLTEQRQEALDGIEDTFNKIVAAETSAKAKADTATTQATIATTQATKAETEATRAEEVASRAVSIVETNSTAAAQLATQKADAVIAQRVAELGVVQGTGNSTTAAMSQKATTDALGDCSNTFKGYTSGKNEVVIDDVSPLTHNIKVTLRRKNILPFPYSTASKTENGVTFTVNDDGSITVSGTPSKDTTFFLYNKATSKPLELDQPVVLSSNLSMNYYSGYYLGVTYTVNGGSIQYINDGAISNIVITPEKTINGIYICARSGYTINVTYRPQLEYGTEATEYEPYFDISNTIVSTPASKNLLAFPYYDKSKTANGVTFTVGDDGSVTINGTPTANTNFILFSNVSAPNLKFNETVTICANSGGGYYDGYYISVAYNVNGGATQYLTEPGTGVSITSEKTVTAILLVARQGYEIKDVTCYPQLEYGTAVTAYEPYRAGFNGVANAKGIVYVPSEYPETTIRVDRSSLTMDIEYSRDINKAIGGDNFESVLTTEGAPWED